MDNLYHSLSNHAGSRLFPFVWSIFGLKNVSLSSSQNYVTLSICYHWVVCKFYFDLKNVSLCFTGLKKYVTLSIIKYEYEYHRQACGCSCLLYCLPDSCACALQGIKCQARIMMIHMIKDDDDSAYDTHDEDDNETLCCINSIIHNDY